MNLAEYNNRHKLTRKKRKIKMNYFQPKLQITFSNTIVKTQITKLKKMNLHD